MGGGSSTTRAHRQGATYSHGGAAAIPVANATAPGVAIAAPAPAAIPGFATRDTGLRPPAFMPPSPHGARLPRSGGRAWIAPGDGRWYVVIRGLEVGVFNGW